MAIINILLFLSFCSKPGYGAFVPFHKLLMAWEWQKYRRMERGPTERIHGFDNLL